MELIFEWGSVNAFTAATRSGRVTALNNELWEKNENVKESQNLGLVRAFKHENYVSKYSTFNESVKFRLGIIVLHAELDKVPASFGGFARPELNLDVANRRLQKHLPMARWLLDVDITHDDVIYKEKMSN